MADNSLNILLVEDNPADYRLIREILNESRTMKFELTLKGRLAEALACLTTVSFDAVLLDLDLPDSRGLQTVTQTITAAPFLPVIVLTGYEDERMGIQAVEKGAQDYLVKGKINEFILTRAIVYACQRKKFADVSHANVLLQQEVMERKQAEATIRLNEMRLKESEQTLHLLTAQLLMAQETERKRIAQELHDSVGQTLSALKFAVECILDRSDTTKGDVYLQSLHKLIPKIQNAIEEVDRIGKGLRPSILDDLGIMATVSWFCREFQSTYSGIRIYKELALTEDEVPDNLKVVVYRILQESLNNIAKHSHADNVHISFEKKGQTITLTVKDNGRGFDVDAALLDSNQRRGLGLFGMIKRAELSEGSLVITSEKEKGTVVSASWPSD